MAKLEAVRYDGNPAVIDMSKVSYVYKDEDGFSIDVGAGKSVSFSEPTYEVAKAAFLQE